MLFALDNSSAPLPFKTTSFDPPSKSHSLDSLDSALSQSFSVEHHPTSRFASLVAPDSDSSFISSPLDSGAASLSTPSLSSSPTTPHPPAPYLNMILGHSDTSSSNQGTGSPAVASSLHGMLPNHGASLSPAHVSSYAAQNLGGYINTSSASSHVSSLASTNGLYGQTHQHQQYPSYSLPPLASPTTVATTASSPAQTPLASSFGAEAWNTPSGTVATASGHSNMYGSGLTTAAPASPFTFAPSPATLYAESGSGTPQYYDASAAAGYPTYSTALSLNNSAPSGAPASTTGFQSYQTFPSAYSSAYNTSSGIPLQASLPQGGLSGHPLAGVISGPVSRMSAYAYRLPLQDRPFKCDQCVQSFNRNHDLKRHRRIHLAVKPFPCGHCDKSFSRKDALKRHMLVKGCGRANQNRQASPDGKASTTAGAARSEGKVEGGSSTAPFDKTRVREDGAMSDSNSSASSSMDASGGARSPEYAGSIGPIRGSPPSGSSQLQMQQQQQQQQRQQQGGQNDYRQSSHHQAGYTQQRSGPIPIQAGISSNHVGTTYSHSSHSQTQPNLSGYDLSSTSAVSSGVGGTGHGLSAHNATGHGSYNSTSLGYSGSVTNPNPSYSYPAQYATPAATNVSIVQQQQQSSAQSGAAGAADQQQYSSHSGGATTPASSYFSLGTASTGTTTPSGGVGTGSMTTAAAAGEGGLKGYPTAGYGYQQSFGHGHHQDGQEGRASPGQFAYQRP